MKDMANENEPLYSPELEQQLLGALLADNDRFHQISGKLNAEHFGDPVHADIYRNIATRITKDHLASPVTLKVDMEDHEGLKELDGPQYLVRMLGASMAGSQIKHYADEIVQLWQRRMLDRAFMDASEAIRAGQGADEARAALELLLTTMPSTYGQENTISMTKMLTTTIEGINEAYAGRTSTITTGLKSLDDKLGGLFRQNLVIIGGRPSMGKAQPLNSKIKTRDSWKRMGEIEIGDQVASVDGKPSVVTGVFPQGELDVYEVTFIDGRTVNCCPDHLWTVESSKFEGQKTVTTKEIEGMLTKERFRGRLFTPTHTGEFGSGELPLDPWLLGFLLADGCLISGVKFSTPDAEILFKIQNMFGFEAVKHTSKYDYAITTPAGQANPTLDKLRSLGLIGLRSHEKFIPDCYKYASKEDRVKILQGILDGDGWVEKFGAVRFSSSSQQFSEDVQELVWSLGGVCSITEKTTTHRNAYLLNIRHPDPASIMTLQKKVHRAKRKKPVRNTIVSVEKVGSEVCQCISVSHPSQLYITDGYIVTHNTSLALEIATSNAKAGKKVAIVSLEMSEDELGQRMLSEHSGIPYFTYRANNLSDDQMRKTIESAKDISMRPITIVPKHIREVASIYAALKKIKANMGGLDLVIVDYLQLMRAKGSGRTEQMTEVSLQLKHFAGLLDVPVVALSQLSRQVENREDKRPMLSDLRESGQIEQDADVVLFCYRDAYYLEREPKPKQPDDLADHEAALTASRKIMEVNIAKQRMGAIGTVKVGCDMTTNRFWDLNKPSEQSSMEDF